MNIPFPQVLALARPHVRGGGGPRDHGLGGLLGPLPPAAGQQRPPRGLCGRDGQRDLHPGGGAAGSRRVVVRCMSIGGAYERKGGNYDHKRLTSEHKSRGGRAYEHNKGSRGKAMQNQIGKATFIYLKTVESTV